MNESTFTQENNGQDTDPQLSPTQADKQETPQNRKTSLSGKVNLSLKIALIGALILLLFVPMYMIKDLIGERKERADSAMAEVQNKWSGSQEIIGPIISVPYYVKEGNGKTDFLHILPEHLEISGNIKTEELKRGLYEVVVYNTPLKLTGKFNLPGGPGLGIPAESLIWKEAKICVGLSDMRGISEQVKMTFGNETLQFSSGLPKNYILNSGVNASIGLEPLLANEKRIIDFAIDLSIKGSKSILFAPLGKTTSVDISSNCTTPSFTGEFLPESREITADGFKSSWKVLDLNRNYAQIFTKTYHIEEQSWSTFGVDLLFPVHQYQQSERSAKYAFLVIILTFVVCFFTEVIQKKNIHPFQYLLVGLTLCLFYTLLIAISEHLSFGLSYLVAASMTIILLTLYMAGVLKIRKTALAIGGLLSLLYCYIFVLIQMETYALLAGSVGLFAILAMIMYFSQKINWNNQ